MDKPSPKPAERSTIFQALGLAWELGYIIAVPLVVLALAGRLADRAWGTSPWLLLLGVLLSIVLSSWLIVVKTRRILDAAATAPRGRGDDRSRNH